MQYRNSAEFSALCYKVFSDITKLKIEIKGVLSRMYDIYFYDLPEIQVSLYSAATSFTQLINNAPDDFYLESFNGKVLVLRYEDESSFREASFELSWLEKSDEELKQVILDEFCKVIPDYNKTLEEINTVLEGMDKYKIVKGEG